MSGRSTHPRVFSARKSARRKRDLIPDVERSQANRGGTLDSHQAGPGLFVERSFLARKRGGAIVEPRRSRELKPGDVADGMKIEALWQKIESYYGQHGYLDMKLSAEPQFDDAAHQISYRVSISEGPQYRMGDMVITGFSLDAEKRLRQAWQLAPGQIFDDGYYEMHVKILAKPSRDIFGDLPVHYNEFGHLLRPEQNATRWMSCWTSSELGNALPA